MAQLQQFSIGYSPCPNDTFIFDALVNKRIASGFDFRVQLEDVETLNRLAREGALDVTKLSYGVYPHVAENYQILPAGSALGRGCGPLLIAAPGFTNKPYDQCKVLIPGKYTTANLLLTMFFPEWKEKQEEVFSAIEHDVLNGTADLGLIIHESRFTYAAKGLVRQHDLGECWEQATGLPIPLGCIAVRRSLPEEQKQEIARLIRESVEYAFRFPEASNDYVATHAQEMSPEVQRSHIALYVNEYSVDLGESGKAAIRQLFDAGVKAGLLPASNLPLFVELPVPVK